MHEVRQTIDRLLATLLVVLMAILVVDVLWQVFSRFVLRNPSSFTEELARYLLIWVSLFGAAYASGQGSHLAVDLLPQRLLGDARRRLEVVIQSVVFLFALTALVVGGGRLVFVTLYLGQTSAALEIPIGYVYLAVPISGLLIMFYAAADLVAALRARASHGVG